MLRDINVIREMLKRAKVEFSEELDQEKNLTISIPSGSREGPNRGYIGFFTDMGFDVNGNLLYVGSWE